ncbi:hypothetical protein SAMN04488102_10717 [Alkalibacterium subtropicum]|uniref:Uncharacterized protein n=1 Tax=Alkalibacterium subtropicum TaxID=753702 RepID=A0A1I1J948_9LACT|nr:hypothetical protein [Alkalibacterium subtropicum]SFC44512.1 hypothetical protein SAMN04488102_10717 [Alkalibacterium subtropicum]
MKKFLTYTGSAAGLIISFALAAVALFFFGVMISLLMNEQTKMEEERAIQQIEQAPEYIEAYNIIDDERGVVVWSDVDSDERGKVLYVRNGTSFQFFDRSGDDIDNNHPVMDEIIDLISKKMVEE